VRAETAGLLRIRLTFTFWLIVSEILGIQAVNRYAGAETIGEKVLDFAVMGDKEGNELWNHLDPQQIGSCRMRESSGKKG
jgi:hypothetical protein